MKIAVLNQKGGVGKTTLSIHIASTLALTGKRVLLIDADAQGSSQDWSSIRKKENLFNVVGISKNIIHKEMPTLSESYDHVVIDGPPHVSSVSKSAIAAADFVLIPVQPSPYDIWASADIVNLIRDMKDTLSGIKEFDVAFVINRIIPNTIIGKDVKEALEVYKDIPVLKSTLTQRVTFAETAGEGTSAIEDDPDSIAGKEIKSLVKEILNFKKEHDKKVA